MKTFFLRTIIAVIVIRRIPQQFPGINFFRFIVPKVLNYNYQEYRERSSSEWDSWLCLMTASTSESSVCEHSDLLLFFRPERKQDL